MKLVIEIPDSIGESIKQNIPEKKLKSLVNVFILGLAAASFQPQADAWKTMAKEIADRVAFNVELKKD